MALSTEASHLFLFPKASRKLERFRISSAEQSYPATWVHALNHAALELPCMAICAAALAGIFGFRLLWPTSHNSILAGVAAALFRLAGGKPATEGPAGTSPLEEGEK
jgi:hypothetical protein